MFEAINAHVYVAAKSSQQNETQTRNEKGERALEQGNIEWYELYLPFESLCKYIVAMLPFNLTHTHMRLNRADSIPYTYSTCLTESPLHWTRWFHISRACYAIEKTEGKKYSFGSPLRTGHKLIILYINPNRLIYVQDRNKNRMPYTQKMWVNNEIAN